MTNKICVSGLPPTMTSEKIKELLSGVEDIKKIAIVRDKSTNLAKIGLVELSSSEDAQKAIKILNGKVINGRTITASEVRPIKI